MIFINYAGFICQSDVTADDQRRIMISDNGINVSIDYIFVSRLIIHISDLV
ncbi:MAG: hypothetical protein ACTS85_02150 [Arsenophonus sp. NC-PG7-MAG3]